MNRYGSDKPDIRFDLSLTDFSIYTERSNLENLQTADVVKAIIIPKADSFSRKVIDELTLFVKEFSSQEKKIPITGLGWMKYSENDLVGGISKFFHTELKREMIKSLNISEGDLVLVAGGERETVLSTMGALRLDIAQRQQLINPEDFKPLWVSDYPLFDWDGDNNNWTFLHHPFTSPAQKDMKNFVKDPKNARSRAYDLVINGWEIAGGSIRNHDPLVQLQIFEILGISKEEARNKFGFLLDGLNFGAPPHGGIAFGFDRFVMILAGAEQIRDVIAFPKTTSALSLMDGSPSEVPENQIKELGIKF